MKNFRHICARLMMIVALGTPVIADDVAETAARTAELQKHVATFQEVPLAVNREDMKFQKVTLNAKPVKFKGVNYDGVRFNTGSATGTFYWAFNASKRIANWYIVPATGKLEQGFTRVDTGILTQDFAGPAKTATKVFFQTLPADALARDTTYVVWFSFRDDAPVEIAVTAAIIGGAPIPSRQRYPMRKPESDELNDAENDTVTTFPASMALTQPVSDALMSAIDPKLFALIQKATEAKGSVSTADEKIKTEIPSGGALLAGFKFGTGGFAGTTIIKTIQPLFLTGEGLKPGNVYGKGNLDRAVLAPPGYAVGAVQVRSGDRLDGIGIRFMKIIPGQLALNPDEAVQSEWMGGEGGSAPRLIGGNGKPVIGVAIKSGDDVDDFGLVLLR